jgi:hypothetical protein
MDLTVAVRPLRDADAPEDGWEVPRIATRFAMKLLETTLRAL